MARKYATDSFEDFLEDAGILVSVNETAMKRVIGWQIAQEMKAQNVSTEDMAQRMQSSPAVVGRILDGTEPTMTLSMLVAAAAALRRRFTWELVVS